MVIDTHAHLTWESFKPDLADVVRRAKEADVKTVINIGADIESNQAAVKLYSPEISMFSSIGLHPHEASRFLNVESIHENINKLEQIYLSAQGQIVAVGECGLDYYFEGNEDFTPTTLSTEDLKALQMVLYKDQIALAKKLQLPLVIHNRDSWDDILIPELSGAKGVFHSFRGTLEQAKQVLDLGYLLGITCVITYPKNDEFRQVVKEIPLEKLLTETDCPYLPPQSNRGGRNEPANAIEVVKTIAEVKGLAPAEVAQITYQNAQQLFKLG